MKNHNRDRQRRKSPWAAQRGDTSSKGENCSCSVTGAVTSNGALTISVLALSVFGVGSVAASIFLELSVSWGSASRVCSNIGRSLPGSPWSIIKLTNTRRPLKGKHNRNDNETKKRVRIGYCFAKVLFFLWMKIYQHHGSACWERRTVAHASVDFCLRLWGRRGFSEEWNDGWFVRQT